MSVIFPPCSMALQSHTGVASAFIDKLFKYNFYYLGRLKREIDLPEAMPESPKQLNRRVTRKPRNPISVGNNPVECNSHNKNGKQCRIWSFRRCIDGKDIGSKECQSQGDPEAKEEDKESRSDCLGVADGFMLTILVFYICRI